MTRVADGSQEEDAASETPSAPAVTSTNKDLTVGESYRGQIVKVMAKGVFIRLKTEEIR